MAGRPIPEAAAAQPQEPVYRTIVRGIDGSPEGLEAVRQAFAVGADGATYWAVSAWDPGGVVHVGVGAFDVMKLLREHAKSALRAAEEAFPDVRPILMRGRDVPAVLAAIGNLEADLVCVGSHGSSRSAGVLFGSVARR
jgi:nucleotide-binding universal stress UspA family protein